MNVAGFVMNDQRIKHLEMIQAIINRMATNSFIIKGWSVTLVSALFALSAKDADGRYVLVSYFPAIIFWILDSYFLYQERLFQNLFDKVRLEAASTTDFSMSTKGLICDRASWEAALVSKTILIFHGTIILTICIVLFSLRISENG